MQVAVHKAALCEKDIMELREPRSRVKDFQPGMTNSDRLLSHAVLTENRSTADAVRPGPVLLLGAPGVGKGTQGEILAKIWRVPKISTGDILRANVSNGTPLGVQAAQMMKSGGLVPDDLVTDMVAERLRDRDTEAGFILDGFPRTVCQAEWLDKYLNAHRKGEALAIVSMCMDHDQILQRVVHRTVCPVCKTVYNTELMPPKRAGHCDLDDAELIQRNDDSAVIFKTRLEVFRRETEPLFEFYRSHFLFIEVDAGKTPSSVTRDISTSLSRLRNQMEQ